MKRKKLAFITEQIPLITLFSVLLSLCFFTYGYASQYVGFMVNIFGWIIDHGGRVIVGLLFIAFLLLAIGCLVLLVYKVVKIISSNSN